MTNEKCPNKEECGSCGWSHIPYEKQLQQKLADINGSFKLKELDVTCSTILPSPITAHYRNRMDFVISFKGEVGLRQKGKWWRVIDNHTCFISDRTIEEKFKVVRDWTKIAGLSFFDRKSHHGFLRYAVIRATTLNQSMVTLVTSAPEESELTHIESQLKALAELLGPTTTLIWAINNTITDVSSGDQLKTISGKGFIVEEVNGFKYRITPNAFFQTNSRAASVLLNTVSDFIPQTKPKLMLDLYCGSGFFSVASASKAERCIGLEISPEMIEDARTNAALNGANVEYRATKTEDSGWHELGADLVILDPPRSGLHDNVLKEIIAAKPKHIIYVSCNYKSFAREAKELVDLNKSYFIEKMTAIDMFPHTPHVELVSLLIAR